VNTAGFRRRAGSRYPPSRCKPGWGTLHPSSRSVSLRTGCERFARDGFRCSGTRAFRPPKRRSASSVPPGPPWRKLSLPTVTGRSAPSGGQCPSSGENRTPSPAIAGRNGAGDSPRPSSLTLCPVPGYRPARPLGLPGRVHSWCRVRPSSSTRSGLSLQPNASVRVASR